MRPAAVATDTDAVYHTLRDEIMRARLRPGRPLNEPDLMRRFAIGRTPLRDALHRLEHEGLVEIWSRRGTFVTQVTVSDLQQVFEFRVMIEPVLARFVVAHCTPRLLAGIRTLSKRAGMSGASASDVSLDREFNALLLDAAGNTYLADTYTRLLDASLRLHYLTDSGVESQQEQLATLDALVAAIDRQDADELSRILVRHDAEFRDRVSQVLFTLGPFGNITAGRAISGSDERRGPRSSRR